MNMPARPNVVVRALARVLRPLVIEIHREIDPAIIRPDPVRKDNPGAGEAEKSDPDWNAPLPRDAFMEHVAGSFADLGLTPGQISALQVIAVSMAFGNFDGMVKTIAAVLEGRGDT
jgi:hypothetical protein